MTGLGALAPAAGGFSETAVRSSTRDAIATCLRFTGEPGELALLGPLSRSSPTDFVEAGAGGLAERGRTSVGALFDCAAVAGGGGATVVAGAAQGRDNSSRLRAVVRRPDGRWGAPALLGRVPAPGQGPVAAAVSARGDVLVAWVETTGTTLRSSGRGRIMAARKVSGGKFGAAEEISPRRPLGRGGQLLLAVGSDVTGAATVVWARPAPDRARYSNLSAVETRSAAPGARFGAVERIARRAQDVAGLQLETAPDGRALVAYSANQAVTVVERAPGGGRFRPLARFGGGLRNEASEPAIAMRADGGAVIAWRSGGFGRGAGGVRAAVRVGPGDLGSAATVDRPRDGGTSSGSFLAFGDLPFAPIDEQNLGLSAALGADGRSVLAWTAPRTLAFGDRPLGPRAAVGTLAGGFGRPATLGCPCRATNGVVALIDAGARPGVAWTDNISDSRFGPGRDLAAGGGRLHLAHPGRPTMPAVPPPRLHLAAPRPQRLHSGQPARVGARCSGPCDLRALVPGARGGRPRAVGSAALERAGRTTFAVRPPFDKNLAPPRPGRVPVVVRAYAPNTSSFSTARVAVRLSRLPAPPTPRPRDVRARREGQSIVVTWRTRRPARKVSFVVDGRRRRSQPARAVHLFDSVEGRGRTRFRARIELKPGDRVRFVAVTASGNVLPSVQRTVVVPVRR